MTARAPRPVARLLAPLLLLAGVAVTGLVTAVPAHAATACPSSQVTVVVDYGSLGGTSVRCASSFSDGIAALQSAGHTVGYVPGQPGFVCTVDARPDPCNGAPASAYWSYWHAKPGGSWSYSSTGAGSYHPAAGSVEGWAFGGGKPPSSAAPSAASTPKPSTSSTSTTTRATTRSSGTTATRPRTTAAAGPSGTTRTAAAPTTASTRATSKATIRTTATRSSTPSATAAAGQTSSGPTGTSAAPSAGTQPTSAASDTPGPELYAGLGAVVLLGGAGGAVAWRRREGSG